MPRDGGGAWLTAWAWLECPGCKTNTVTCVTGMRPGMSHEVMQLHLKLQYTPSSRPRAQPAPDQSKSLRQDCPREEQYPKKCPEVSWVSGMRGRLMQSKPLCRGDVCPGERSTVGKKSPSHTLHAQVHTNVQSTAYALIPTSVQRHAPTNVPVQICMHPHTRTCVYTHVCIQVRILMHMCAHTGMYNHCFARALTLRENSMELGSCQGVIYFNY